MALKKRKKKKTSKSQLKEIRRKKLGFGNFKFWLP